MLVQDLGSSLVTVMCDRQGWSTEKKCAWSVKNVVKDVRQMTLSLYRIQKRGVAVTYIHASRTGQDKLEEHPLQERVWLLGDYEGKKETSTADEP